MDRDECVARRGERRRAAVGGGVGRLGTCGAAVLTAAPPAPSRRARACVRVCVCVQVSFIAFHWEMGTPFWEDQGTYSDLSFWEQLDGGRPWTPTRKFLMVVPVIL